MRILRKVISACGAAIIVVALAVAFVGTEGPTRVSASATASASRAQALEITPRDRTQDAAGLPAVWVPHDVMVAYRNLPRAYSCDALWYKVRDILREAGAWRSVSITPYDCKPSTASDGRSPQLEIRFLTLRTLRPAQARLAQARVAHRTVTLKPGSPESLGPGDCALLAQTQQDVLSLVSSIHPVERNLDCKRPRTSSAYSLALQTLVPVRARQAAAGGAGRAARADVTARIAR
jgi:hypothetical protein